jgi:hypothetical protein
MLQNTQIPSVIMVFLKKAISYDNGALALLSVSVGTVFAEIFKVIFHGVNQRDLYLPLFFASGSFVLYVIMFMGDFLTGIVASRHESSLEGRDDYIMSSKLWRSFWKFFGVMAILFIITGFCLMLVLFDNHFFYNVFLISIPSIMLMVILFEFHSIGENIKRRFGYKPTYFEFFDKLSKSIETGIINKVGSWFSK